MLFIFHILSTPKKISILDVVKAKKEETIMLEFYFTFFFFVLWQFYLEEIN